MELVSEIVQRYFEGLLSDFAIVCLVGNVVPDVLTCPPAQKGHIYKGGELLLSDGSSQKSL